MGTKTKDFIFYASVAYIVFMAVALGLYLTLRIREQAMLWSAAKTARREARDG